MAKRQDEPAARPPKMHDATLAYEPCMTVAEWAAARVAPLWTVALGGDHRKTAAQWDVWFSETRDRVV